MAASGRTGWTVLGKKQPPSLSGLTQHKLISGSCGLTAGHWGIQTPFPYDQKSHCRGVQSYPTTCLGGGECLWAVPVTAQWKQSHRVLCTPTKTWAPQGQRPSFESWYHQYCASPRVNGEFLTNDWMNVLIHGFDFQNLLRFSKCVDPGTSAYILSPNFPSRFSAPPEANTVSRSLQSRPLGQGRDLWHLHSTRLMEQLACQWLCHLLSGTQELAIRSQDGEKGAA